MRFPHTRIMAVIGVSALSVVIAGSAGLAPPAGASTVLATPTNEMTSPAPLGGLPSDVCGDEQPYGYIGLDDITFSADVSGPAGQALNAEFYILPGDGSAPVDYVVPAVSGSAAQVTVYRYLGIFKDGVTYSWRVRETDGNGDYSAWTHYCHFISDQTAPPSPTVLSSVFPPTGGPVARTPGTFTFSVSGPDLGAVVGFDYQLNNQLGAGSESQFPAYGNSFVPIGKDGTATTPTLIPTLPGPNFITVDAVDRGGNISQPVQYNFSLGYPAPDKRSDLNGDGFPDLVATSAGGHLYVYYGNGHGSQFRRHSYLDTGTGWAQQLIAQNGNFTIGPYQDLLGISNGNLFLYPNNGLGDFNVPQARLEYRPSNGSNWSTVNQLVAPGDVTGDGLPDLITVEGGNLLFWPGQYVGFGSAVVIGTGWQHLQIVGAADFNGDGKVDLLARDSSGRLWLYLGKGNGWFAGPRHRILVGTGFTAAKYPLMTSVGDANGDGIPDLYATTAHGNLVFIPGRKGGLSFGRPVATIGTNTDWKLIRAIA